MMSEHANYKAGLANKAALALLTNATAERQQPKSVQQISAFGHHDFCQRELIPYVPAFMFTPQPYMHLHYLGYPLFYTVNGANMASVPGR